MSETARDRAVAAEDNKTGPDFFGVYTSEVAELLSQDEDFSPFSPHISGSAGNPHKLSREKRTSKNICTTKENNGINGFASLYSNGIGALLSEFKKERLKSLLRQSVFTLVQEVDERIDPVLSICRIRSCLRYKKSLLSHDSLANEVDQVERPHKKLKVWPPFSDSESEHVHLAVQGKEVSNGGRVCTECHKNDTPQWRPGPDGTKSLCNACGLRFRKVQPSESKMVPDAEAHKESGEIDNDLLLLLRSDSTKVEELMKKHSSEISSMINHMEQKLEELLDLVMSTCRSMTIAEKQQLRRLIQSLPPENLDRVVEIIRRNEPSEKYSSDPVHVDLDVEDKVTSWRLYNYIAAVKSARTLREDR